MEILVVELEKAYKIEIQWLNSSPMRFNKFGKYFPLTTTCRIYQEFEARGKKLASEDFVIKHSLDLDNQVFAMALSLKKALKYAWFLQKKERTVIWKEFNSKYRNNEKVL